MYKDKKISVVIPSYKVTKFIEGVVSSIPSFVDKIYIVDDCCPDNSGKFVETKIKDDRVVVLYNEVNLGVGGATKHGFKASIENDIDIAVKLDGDGQMDPIEIPRLLEPIINGRADYTKGNRFFSPRALKGMPFVRKFGNAGLSFLTKISSGYWNVMDPTNGYLAASTSALRFVELEKVSDRYFFESDMLFRLNLSNCVVKDIPIAAIYGDEESHMNIKQVLFSFSTLHVNRFVKRLVYRYFVNDFNIGSIQLLFGSIIFSLGIIYSLSMWIIGNINNQASEFGAIMLASLCLILGFQLLLSFINIDILNVPKEPISN